MRGNGDNDNNNLIMDLTNSNDHDGMTMNGLQNLENFSMDQFIDLDGTTDGANNMDFGSLGLDLGTDFAWPSSFPGSTSTTSDDIIESTINTTSDDKTEASLSPFNPSAFISSELSITPVQTLPTATTITAAS